MAWDDDKEVAPGTDAGELTPDEWNEHVADQKGHAGRHEGGADSLNVFNLTGDLVGQGLERVNDTLQVLSSIYDGTNLTAPVDNQSVVTEQLSIGETVAVLRNASESTTLSDGAETKLEWDQTGRVDDDILDVDLSNNEVTVEESGDYLILLRYSVDGDSNWSTGDQARPALFLDGSQNQFNRKLKIGTGSQGFNWFVYLWDLDADRTLDIRVLQNSGESQSIRPDRNTNDWIINKVA